MVKPLTVWVTTNCGKSLKKWEYQTTLPDSWETWMQVKKQQLELDMEQRTGSKLGKEYDKTVYRHPAYLTYTQNEYIIWNARRDETQAGIKIAGRNINSLRQADNTTLMWFFLWSCMDVRVGLWRRLSAEELMLLNCGVGEDSWESLGLQRGPTSPFWRRSALGFLWKEWC